MLHGKLALAAGGLLALVSTQSMAALSASDKDFLQKAAAGGMAEVSLGQLAQQNASSQQVKDFGQRMMTDHGQANDQLRQLAQSKNVTLPNGPAAKDQAMQKQLSGLKGSAFDTAYTSDMVRDHQQDVAEFQKEARSGQDPDLKAFAQKTLPVLQQHLQMAQAVGGRK